MILQRTIKLRPQHRIWRSFTRTFLDSLLKPTTNWKLHPVSGTLGVPEEITRPPYARGIPAIDSSGDASQDVVLYDKEELEKIRKVCEITSQIRAFAGRQCEVGRSTDEIDRAVHEKICSVGVYPSPLGYKGFPKSCCTSVNEVVCHGIPDSRPLEDKDIINIDVSTYKEGFHGDCSGMFMVGSVESADRDLVKHTIEATMQAINMCAPGVPISQIGQVIAEYALKRGYGIVPNFCGHGIGRDFHMPPQIIHVPNRVPGVMVPGMVFTIEPILTLGEEFESFMMEDGWTYVTRQGSRAAQYEETILITDSGSEILTKHSVELD